MFSHNGYGPGTPGPWPKSSWGRGLGGRSFWALGFGSQAHIHYGIMAEPMCIRAIIKHYITGSRIYNINVGFAFAFVFAYLLTYGTAHVPTYYTVLYARAIQLIYTYIYIYVYKTLSNTDKV